MYTRLLTRSKWGKPHKISDDKFILAGYYFLMIDTFHNYVAARFIFGIPHHESDKPYMQLLNWLPVQEN